MIFGANTAKQRLMAVQPVYVEWNAEDGTRCRARLVGMRKHRGGEMTVDVLRQERFIRRAEFDFSFDNGSRL